MGQEKVGRGRWRVKKCISVLCSAKHNKENKIESDIQLGCSCNGGCRRQVRLAESSLQTPCRVAVEPRGLRSNCEEPREAAGSAEVGKAPQMAGFSNRNVFAQSGDRKSEIQGQQGHFF